MTEYEIINIIETTLEEKIEQNPNFIRYTFYEIIVKHNLSKKADSIIEKLKNNKIDTLGKLCKQSKTDLKEIGIEQYEAKSIDIELQLIGLSLKGSL